MSKMLALQWLLRNSQVECKNSFFLNKITNCYQIMTGNYSL